jgi:hypothetical protein
MKILVIVLSLPLAEALFQTTILPESSIAEIIRDNGITAVVLGWFMFRYEKRMDAIIEALSLIKAAIMLQERDKGE